MRNVVAALRRPHRLNTLLSTSFVNGCYNETLLWKFSSSGVKNCAGVDVICRHGLAFSQFYLLRRCPYSTGFTSVHGEGPSADYAKLRRKALESEFGNVLGAQISRTEKVSVFYRSGPFLALYRAAVISFHVLRLTAWHFFFRDMKIRSIKFRETLISLGPFYVKLGQALSTRPDILSNVYCQELSKLQDQIPPFPTHVAIKSIESQLGCPVSQIFADISSVPIAAASLGQVYKAHLHSGELVAVKVQRPGMALTLTLDALLFNMIGGQLKRFAAAREDLLVAVNEMVRHMFDEIDYILEGQNADRFASLYGSYPCPSRQLVTSEGVYSLFDVAAGDQQYPSYIAGATIKLKKRNIVKVPKIFWKYTRKAVLTMEWIDGIKLTDEANLINAFLNRKKLINQGVYCSLRQLLEVGFFHADPHPGNLVATKDGSLAYFDFGMMGNIPRHYRVGLIQVIVHFVNRDSLGLAKDYLSLGFLPEGVNIQSVANALRSSFSDEKNQSRDFQAIMNQLYGVMYEFNFSLPPDYALVIRALGSLEGTAKALDPDFKVVESAYPFVIGRLLEDPDPDMRKILRELVIRNDGSIRWNRLERLIAAISEQASESDGESSNATTDSSNPLGWKSFDMHAVVSASEDLFEFILSEKGERVRVFLVWDILKAIDAVLLDESLAIHETSESEEKVIIERVTNGLRSFQHAVKLAPNLWVEMFIRMAMKPEVHRFSTDILSAMHTHVNSKASETFWISLSKLLRGF